MGRWMHELDSTRVTTESSGFAGEGKEFMGLGWGEVGVEGEGEVRETNMVVMKEVMVAATAAVAVAHTCATQ